MSEERKMAPVGRLYSFLLIFLLCSIALVARAVNLQIIDTEYLQDQGEARYLRDIEVPSPRGNILDRNGEPLAVSTPVSSLGVNPRKLLEVPDGINRLAEVLGADADALERRIAQRAKRGFVWVRRRLHPDMAQAVLDLQISGIDMRKEYRRFYPAGEVTAHLVGLTNIDDEGQEGLESAYDDWLSGEPGVKRVIRDAQNNIIEHVETVKEAVPGKDLRLTIDRRLQYLAYRELKRTVLEHGALSGLSLIHL